MSSVHWRRMGGCVVALAALAGVPAALAVPPGFVLHNAVPGGVFNTPTALAFLPDGRMLVAEKRGRVRMVVDGVRLPTPFLDLAEEVLDHYDRGLLGLAVDPDFAVNGHVYLLYTVDHDTSGDRPREDAFGRLVRYTVSAADTNRAEPSSRHVVIGETFGAGLPACSFSHSPGSLRFGSDGTLLVSTGDAASFYIVDAGGLYPECFGPGRFGELEDVGAFRAPYLHTLAGKILRLDPATGLGLPSNPHYTGDPADLASRVWASGLRNPFRFAVVTDGSDDPADGEPGTLVVGDVGWGTWEELNVVRGGEFFGWPCFEGPLPMNAYQFADPAHGDCTTVGEPTPPAMYWHHVLPALSSPPGLVAHAVVAGDVYRGTKYPPGYQGRLFYADYADGWLATAAVDAQGNLLQHELFDPDAGGPVDIRYDPVSEYLHYVNINDGVVMVIRPVADNNPPQAVVVAAPTEGYAPLVVQFGGSLSHDPDDDALTFAWTFGDGGTADEPDPAHTYAFDGTYTATLTVSDPSGALASETVRIDVGNTSPRATIVSPADGAGFAAGATVELLANAEDDEEPAAGLHYFWEVVQHHNGHAHPPIFTAEGPAAQFTVTPHGQLKDVEYLAVVLTVTDAGGLTGRRRHLLWVHQEAESDVTTAGAPVALVMEPIGGGSPDIAVIHDGILPPAGDDDLLQQYATYDGTPQAEDWIGYTLSEPQSFSRLLFQDGVHAAGGGWFDDLRVQVRTDGTWSDVLYLQSVPAYPGQAGPSYTTYVLLFQPMTGDAIRLFGGAGGPDGYVSVGELRVFALPRVDFTATPRQGEGPLTVDFREQSSVALPTGFHWDFGDGSESVLRHPRHVFAQPGTYDVTLTVSYAHGDLSLRRADYVAVDVLHLTLEDQASFATLARNGAASVDDGVLRLVPDAAHQAGSAFLATTIPFTDDTSLSAAIRFRIHGEATHGSEGLVFMLQGAGITALGDGGAGLGYGGIAPSLGVELDIAYSGIELDNNHVAVDLDGDFRNSLVSRQPGFVLQDGAAHGLWVDYDGPANLLRVFVSADPDLKSLQPRLEVPELDLSGLVGAPTTLGFSASTGVVPKAHDIEAWDLRVTSPGIGASPAGPPAIFAISPSSGDAGTRAVVTGANLGATTAVYLGDLACTLFSALSGSQLLVDIPVGALTGPLRVLTLDGDAIGPEDFVIGDPGRFTLEFPDFVQATSLQTNGTAATTPTRLRLAEAAPGQTGSAFYRAALPIDEDLPFSTTARLRFSDAANGGAEGLAFVLQGAGPGALGMGEGGLGYGGLTPALAVEIDLVADPGGPPGSHVAVHLNGDATTPVAVAAIPFAIADGAALGLWIDHDGSADSLAVYLSPDPQTRPDAPLLVVVGAGLTAAMAGPGHAGFTGATGTDAWAALDVEAWQFTARLPDPGLTAVAASPGLPARAALGRVYPNPANPRVAIEYALPSPQDLTLAVYAIDGKRVRTLLAGRRPAGPGQVFWDGTDDRNRRVSSGVYFVRLFAGPTTDIRKLVLLK